MNHARSLWIYVGLLMAISMLWLQAGSSLIAQQPENDAAGEAPAAAPDADGAPADAEQAGDEEQTSDEKDSTKSLGEIIFRRPETAADWFSVGFYAVLFIFSMVATTIAIERLFHLRRERILPADFVKKLHNLIQGKEDTEENLRALAESSKSPVAKVLQGGLYRAGRPLVEVEKGMEDALYREMAAIRARHRPLGVIGSVAPLVGLLGTVVGIMFAFMTSSEHGLQDTSAAAALAKGIYLALITTAAGLTIAIPCMLFVAWFNTRTERYFREMDEELLTVTPSFSRMARDSEYESQGAARESSNNDEARVAVTAK